LRLNTKQHPEGASNTFPTLREFRQSAIAQAEKQYLIDMSAHTEGNIQMACQVSGLGRSRLYDLLKKYAISF
jgi:two-component system NtrC family response regulator